MDLADSGNQFDGSTDGTLHNVLKLKTPLVFTREE